MPEEWGNQEEEETGYGGAEEEDEFRGETQEAFFEDDACDTETETAEEDGSITAMEMEAAVDIAEDNDKDSTEHEDARGNMRSSEMFMEEANGKHDGEEGFSSSNELSIHCFCGLESHVPEPEAYDDERAEEEESENLFP